MGAEQNNKGCLPVSRDKIGLVYNALIHIYWQNDRMNCMFGISQKISKPEGVKFGQNNNN